MQIEKGIPVPIIGGKAPAYPFDKLDVGDSFAVRKQDGNKMRMQASIYKKRHPDWDFTTRTQNNGDVRLWRVA